MDSRPGRRWSCAATLLIIALWVPAHGASGVVPTAQAPSAPRTTAGVTAAMATSGDDEFLEDLSRRSFMFFWEQADAATGIVRDWAGRDEAPPRTLRHARLAALLPSASASQEYASPRSEDGSRAISFWTAPAGR